MRKGFIYLANSLLLLGFIKANAQQDSLKRFSLAEAQQYAMENNLNIRNAELDIKIAKKKVWETTAIGLPQVNGSVNYQRILSDLPSFPMGENGETIKIGNEETTTYGLNASQLIFSGEYIVGLQASKTYKDLSLQSLKKSEADVKEIVTQAYYIILVAEENKIIIDQNLENIEKIYNETLKMYEAGFVEDSNADQLKIMVTNLKNAKASVERQIEMGYDLFKFQTGIPMEDKVELTESLESILSKINVEMIASQQFSLESNIDYQLLETQEKLAKLSLKREKSTMLPQVAGFVNYQEFVKEPMINFQPSTVAGLNVSIPILSSGSRLTKIQQSKINLMKMQNSKEMASDGLLLGVQQAKIDFSNALEKYYNEKDNVDLTQKIYDKTSIKFKEGMASSYELTQSHTQLLTTQGNYFNSIFQLLNAKNKLDKALNNY